MSQTKPLTEEQIQKKKAKEERRLAFEAARALENKNPKDDKAGKTKGDLKRERRELQEKQRAAKIEQKPNPSAKKQPNKTSSPNDDTVDFKISSNEKPIHLIDHHNLKEQFKDVYSEDVESHSFSQSKNQAKSSPKSSRTIRSSPSFSSYERDHQSFAHIPKRETDLIELTKSLGYNGTSIHSDIIKVGLRMNQNLISDPTTRCISFLVALKNAFRDYEQPNLESVKIPADLNNKLEEYTKFLDRCRPLSVSMTNVIRIIRSQIFKLSLDLNLKEAKSHLVDSIDRFMYEEVECGLNGIREHGNLKISDNDVILTFGDSFLIKHIFKEAKENGKKFRVVVVDSHPRLDGKKFLEFLNQLNIEATYVLISAISYVMKEVNKVLIEAHTLLANGYMISDMGSSQIALVAKSHNVPVLICCETYKFSERVHTDSFVFNEADSPKDFLASLNAKSDLRKLVDDDLEVKKSSHLNILNLYYDVTPRDFISLVITEMGFLPSTAVPAIIRRNICKFHLSLNQN